MDLKLIIVFVQLAVVHASCPFKHDTKVRQKRQVQPTSGSIGVASTSSSSSASNWSAWSSSSSSSSGSSSGSSSSGSSSSSSSSSTTGMAIPRDLIIQFYDVRNFTQIAQQAVATKRQSELFFYQIGVDRVPRQSTTFLHNIFIATQPDAKVFGDAGIAVEAVSRAIANTFRSTGRGHEVPTNGATLPSVPQPDDTRIPQVTCPYRRPKCDAEVIYRSPDGSCNNLANPDWGMSDTPQRRFLPSKYDDRISSARNTDRTGGPLPSPRLVSTIVHEENRNAGVSGLTHILMQWGQFVDHDITSTPIETGLDSVAIRCCIQDVSASADPRLVVDSRGFIVRDECFPIEIPVGDHRFPRRQCMNFVRSLPAVNRDCRFGSREQLNQITAYLDGSQIYGETTETQTNLRGQRGTLRSKGDFLPEDSEPTCLPSGRGDYCFKAGDDRVNEQSSLASLHTVWMREHNNIARALGQRNPSWDDEKVFQESRKIIIALLQHITYNEWLPVVLGRNLMQRFNLQTRNGFQNSYDANVDASIRNGFSTAAFRFGHSLVQPLFNRYGQGYTAQFSAGMRLQDMYANTMPTLDNNGDGINMLIRGLISDPPQSCDRYITNQLTDHLFEDANGNALDLAALNIQRGRDHGLPAYNDWRQMCGLRRATPGNFPDHTFDAAQRLTAAYAHPDDIDLFAGGVSERPISGGIIGPTFACIIVRQFSFLKRGDRFWYETGDKKIAFSAEQLSEIKKMTLARVFCDTTNIQGIQPLGFRAPGSGNDRKSCQAIPGLDLQFWTDEPPVQQSQAFWTTWNNWSAGCNQGSRFRQRFCFGNAPCPGSNVEFQRCPTQPPQHNCRQFQFGLICF